MSWSPSEPDWLTDLILVYFSRCMSLPWTPTSNLVGQMCLCVKMGRLEVARLHRSSPPKRSSHLSTAKHSPYRMAPKCTILWETFWKPFSILSNFIDRIVACSDRSIYIYITYYLLATLADPMPSQQVWTSLANCSLLSFCCFDVESESPMAGAFTRLWTGPPTSRCRDWYLGGRWRKWN